MLTENNTVKTRNGILDKNFFRLIRRHWKELPSLFKENIVKEVYNECHSLRKTAKTLGIGKTTVYYYVKQKDPLHYTSFPNETALDFLESTLPQLIQIHSENKATSPPTGDDANLTQC